MYHSIAANTHDTTTIPQILFQHFLGIYHTATAIIVPRQQQQPSIPFAKSTLLEGNIGTQHGNDSRR